MDIYFVSSNKFKLQEVQEILNSENIRILPVELKINEIQSDNMEEIVTDKALKAFQEIGRHVLVEQTGLLIKDFGKFTRWFNTNFLGFFTSG